MVQELCHGLTERFCTGNAFLISQDIADIPPNPDRGEAGDYHLASKDEVEHGIRRAAGTGTPYGDRGVPHLVLEEVAVGKGDKPGPVD